MEHGVNWVHCRDTGKRDIYYATTFWWRQKKSTSKTEISVSSIVLDNL